MKKTNKEDIVDFLRDIKEVFAKDGVLIVGLFGSFAKNSENIYSDIDIAIKKDKTILQKDYAYRYFEILSKLKKEIKQTFSKNVDILDLNDPEDVISWILKNAKEV